MSSVKDLPPHLSAEVSAAYLSGYTTACQEANKKRESVLAIEGAIHGVIGNDYTDLIKSSTYCALRSQHLHHLKCLEEACEEQSATIRSTTKAKTDAIQKEHAPTIGRIRADLYFLNVLHT